jgi:predicted DNA-binding transcriptional regulator AlpA
MDNPVFYRVGKVSEIFGWSINTTWRKAKIDPEFPKPIKISDNVTAWRSDQVLAYRQKLIDGSAKAA